MGKRKKILFIFCLSLMVLVLGGAGVYAYLTDGDTKTNKTTVGGVHTTVTENFDPPKSLKPGTVITKNVKVTNNGPNDCYVRVKAVFSDSDMQKYCNVDFNTTDFAYNSTDGYYYYKKALKKGESTASLMTKVTLSTSIPEDEIKAFDIIVYQEGYQSNGFSDYQSAWKDYQKNLPK